MNNITVTREAGHELDQLVELYLFRRRTLMHPTDPFPPSEGKWVCSYCGVGYDQRARACAKPWSTDITLAGTLMSHLELKAAAKHASFEVGTKGSTDDEGHWWVNFCMVPRQGAIFSEAHVISGPTLPLTLARATWWLQAPRVVNQAEVPPEWKTRP